MGSKNLKINWLGKCPKCERTEHTVTTLNGNKKFLYDEDIVECWCGQKGLIDSDGFGSAWCEWDEQPLTSLNVFNDYYREKFPSNWDLLPKSNHHACSHYYELLNAWQAAKASPVHEGFVLVDEDVLVEIKDSFSLLQEDIVVHRDYGTEFTAKRDFNEVLERVTKLKTMIETQDQMNLTKFDGYVPMQSRGEEPSND